MFIYIDIFYIDIFGKMIFKIELQNKERKLIFEQNVIAS